MKTLVWPFPFHGVFAVIRSDISNMDQLSQMADLCTVSRSVSIIWTTDSTAVLQGQSLKKAAQRSAAFVFLAS